MTIKDPIGLSTTSSVNVTVNQTLTTISLAGQPLTATALDQFDNSLASQPAFDAGTNTITSPLALAGNVTVLPAADSQLTISGAISGAGALIVGQAGTLVLNGPNTDTGGTIVSAGTLIVANSSAIAAGTSLTVGASLIFDSSSLTTFQATALGATSAATAASAALTRLVLPAPTAANVVNNSPADGNVPLPSVPPTVLRPRRSVAGAVAGAFAAKQVAWSSLARQIVGDPAWLGQDASSSDSSDLQHRKAAAVHALDAVFSQYGR